MKRITKIGGAIVAMLLLIFAMSACSASTTAGQANSADANTSAQILHKMQQAQPVPQFDYSQIRQTLIDAETATAQSTQTTTFFFNQGVTDPVFVCPSIGFPVAATSQITNPDQVSDGANQADTGTGNTTIAQIDPNGIYSGSSSATYVICVNGQGKAYLHHAEEFAHAISGPATWDYTHHRIQITGDPTFSPKVGK
jgi:hypothetical protein